MVTDKEIDLKIQEMEKKLILAIEKSIKNEKALEKNQIELEKTIEQLKKIEKELKDLKKI